MNTKESQKFLIKQNKQNQLNYRTKIIELEKQSQYWKQRAEEYQKKFKDAILSSQYYTNDELLRKLEERQNEINQLRTNLLEVQRLYSRSGIDVQSQKQKQLKIIIEELKEGAIKAIMQKDSQIEELEHRLKDKAYQRHINQLNQRYQNLHKIHQQTISSHEAQIEHMNEKLNENREQFMQKLISLQKQISHSQTIKQILIQKTNNLQGTLVSSQKVIVSYEDKIHELQNNLILEKLKCTQSESKIKMQYDALQQLQKSLQKQCLKLQNEIKDYKYKEERYHDQISNLKEQKQLIWNKLQAKKRKDILKLSASMIAPSPQMFVKNVNLFSSFYRSNIQEDQIDSGEKEDLREIKQLDEYNLIENFTGYEQIQTQQVQQIKSRSKKSFDGIQRQQFIKIQKELKIIQDKNKQLQNKNQNILNRNKQLQSKQQTLFNRIQQLTKSIKQVTQDLQRERKLASDLRQQLKKSIKQSQLIIQLQSIKQHMFKIESAFLSQKLKNAQRMQYQKQIYQIEKQMWSDQIQVLKQKLFAFQIPKKKKKSILKS